MWVVISGPPGTSKNKIAEILIKYGFEYLSHRVLPNDDKSVFDRELGYLVDRAVNQIDIERRPKSKIVTVRSFWDFDVYGRVLSKRTVLSPGEYEILKTHVYEPFLEVLKPPDFFIFLNCQDKMASFNRMMLESNVINQEYFFDLVDAYDEFRGKLTVPVIEVEHGSNVEDVMSQVEFGLSSIASTGVATETIWSKGVFK